jgi:hypothetical protein
LPLPAAETNKFIKVLQVKTRIKDLSKKVKVEDKRKHLQAHMRMDDLDDNFDIDFDLK